MKTRREILALLAGAAAACAGCKHKGEDGPAGAKIGYSLADLSVPYQQAMQAGARGYAREHRFDLLFADAKGDASTQDRQIQRLLKQGISVVVIDPVDPTKLSAGLQKARSAGIYIVMLERSSPKEEVATLVDFNQELAGRLAADYLVRKAPAVAAVAILRAGGDAPEKQRVAAFRKYLQQHKPGMRVVSEQAAAGDGTEESKRLLSAHPDLSAIYAGSDVLARSAAGAVSAAGGKAVVIAYGSEPATADEIKKGGPLALMTAGVPQHLGLAGARSAWRIAGNEPVTPHLSMPLLPVTRDNLGEYPGWTHAPPRKPEIPWPSDLELKPRRE